ncbi:MAG: hypothetical protein VKI39_07740, partial [Synechococcus sp.]|nr:hypothetical protein [Synechococcus sp.]
RSSEWHSMAFSSPALCISIDYWSRASCISASCIATLHHTLTIALRLESHISALRITHYAWRMAPMRALHRTTVQLPAAYQQRSDNFQGNCDT